MADPEDISGEERIVLPREDESWYVVHTRPRCEKKLSDFMKLEGYVTYLPLRAARHQYGNRIRTFMNPLFPGYTFCLVDARGLATLRQNRYVANALMVVEQEKLVRQLRQVERVLAAGDQLEVQPYIQTGNVVVVKHGPLKGLEGVVARIKGKTRVVINVDMIQKSVACEVDSASLIPG